MRRDPLRRLRDRHLGIVLGFIGGVLAESRHENHVEVTCEWCQIKCGGTK